MHCLYTCSAGFCHPSLLILNIAVIKGRVDPYIPNIRSLVISLRTTTLYEGTVMQDMLCRVHLNIDVGIMS